MAGARQIAVIPICAPMGRGEDGAAASKTAVTTGDVPGLGTGGSFTNMKLPPFDALSDELFIQILQRLPIKDANRCKCVAKRWLNSISSSYFARSYTLHHSSFPPPSALFFHYKHSTDWVSPTDQMGVQSASENPIFDSPGFSLTFLPPSRPVKFLTSNNGLVLCSATTTFQRVYYVCNPLSKHWITLPPPSTCFREVRIGFICSPDSFEISNFRFWVVRIPAFESKTMHYDTLKLEIFSSETGKWTESVFTCNEPRLCSGCLWDGAVVCRGILHWSELFRGYIFAYDPFKTSQYRIIGLPEVKLEHSINPLFGESQGCLLYAEYNCLVCTFSIWELKDYNGGEWSLVHRFNRSQIVPEISELDKYSCFSMMLLAFDPVDKDVMFLGFPGCIIKCNMRSTSLEPFCPLASQAICASKAFPYVLPWWPILVPLLPH